MDHYVGHYISNFLPITEVWLYNLIKNHQLYKPIVFARKANNKNHFSMDKMMVVEDLPLPDYIYNFLIFKTRGYFPLFSRACENQHCQIVHAHFGYNGYKTIRLAAKVQRPLLCSFYGVDVFKYPRDPLNKNKYLELFNTFSAGIVLGPHMKQSLMELGCPENKIEINHLGVEVDKIAFKPRHFSGNRPFRFLIASSFIEKKGIDIALKALKSIEDYCDFVVEIVGDGPLRGDIQSLIKDFQLEEKVVLHGYQPYGYFLNLAYSCDGYLQASKLSKDGDKEGTPMAIIDAMATGLPAISTYHSDIPEIIDDGKTGYLAVEDSPESFAEVLKKYIGQSHEMETFSYNSRAKIEREFNISHQMKRLEQIYLKYQT
jgi:colanic acid/amylovoran biosynthesis glycosyltransferase